MIVLVGFFCIDGTTYFPLHDIQGSLVTMIDHKGNPHGASRYTAFGEQQTKDRYSPWRFAGKRMMKKQILSILAGAIMRRI